MIKITTAEYEKNLMDKLISYDLNPEPTFLGIRVENGFDGWIIQVKYMEDERLARVTLYHRNMMIKRIPHKKMSRIPDYHIQVDKPCTINYLCRKIVNHTEKYKCKKLMYGRM